MGVVVWVWVLVRVRVPAWMPVAAHHGIRWLYGRVRRSAGWRRELCRGKRWVAQEDSRTGESKGSGIRADAVQLRSRARQRMNRLEPPWSRGGLGGRPGTGLCWLRGNALLQCEEQETHPRWHAAGT